MKTEIDYTLRREREKLDLLVDEAIERGKPISEAVEIIEQSRKVNGIVKEHMEREDTEKE